MEFLTSEELIEEIHKYIRDNYYYISANITSDSIQYVLDDNKVINVCVTLEDNFDD